MKWSAGAPTRSDDDPEPDAEAVIARLEEAGATLLRMPRFVYGRAPLTVWPQIVQDHEEAYGWTKMKLRPAQPSAGEVTRMDRAFELLAHIPDDRYVLRRVVGLRALVHPVTDRHVWTWGRIAFAVGADRRAVAQWHEQGVALIVAGLRRGAR